GRNGHPPRRDLDRIELVEAVVAKGLHCAGEEEAQFRERHRRDLVLCEGLVDEPRECQPSPDPALSAELLQAPFHPRPRVRLASEAAALHALGVASASSVAVGPERSPIRGPSREFEYLTLLQHQVTPFNWEQRECRRARRVSPSTRAAEPTTSLREELAAPSSSARRIRVTPRGRRAPVRLRRRSAHANRRKQRRGAAQTLSVVEHNCRRARGRADGLTNTRQTLEDRLPRAERR